MSPGSFAGKTAVVTGAAGGIGSELCRQLVDAGARVAALDIDAARLDALAQELGDRCLAIACDIRTQAACSEAIDHAARAFGAVDLLINNAGISHHSRFASTDAAVIERVMDVNFWGAVQMTRAALAGLLAQRGVIVVVSSVAGFAPLLDRAGYAASKHALHGMFETLAAELRPAGVSVVMVCPSFVRTDIDRRAVDAGGHPGVAKKRVAGRLLEPDRVARQILAAAQRRRRRLIPSATGKLAFALAALAPGLYERLMVRSVG